jgi:UDP-N-acetyl-D-mannosaminuronic acid dehydrogenase
LGAVQHSAKQVAEVMTDGSLVILRSTVRLGTAREVVKPILDATGRKFDLAVCPERTLEGRALAELHELPQIIGADDPDVRARCAHMFGVITPTTVTLSSLEAAELAKLVDNTYRDVTFAFANEVAKLCGHAGLSAREILRAGRLGYPRNNVAMPGPVGGPCLEKDPHILAESASAYGVNMAITRASRAINEEQPADTVALIKGQVEAMKGFPKAPRITLAGLAFKGHPPTDDLRGTMAKPILQALREAFPKARFKTFDPVVPHAAAQEYFGIEPVATLQEAFADANIVVIANNHPVFQGADIASLARVMNAPGVVYDYWSMHDDIEEAMPEGVRYLALGGERYLS